VNFGSCALYIGAGGKAYYPLNSRVAHHQGIEEVDFGHIDQVHSRSTPTGGGRDSNPVRPAQLELMGHKEGIVWRARQRISVLHRIQAQL
jgi:hypothetical protein